LKLLHRLKLELFYNGRGMIFHDCHNLTKLTHKHPFQKFIIKCCTGGSNPKDLSPYSVEIYIMQILLHKPKTL